MTDEYRSEWQNADPAGAHLAATTGYEPSTQATSTSQESSEDQGKAGAVKEQAAVMGQGAAQAGQQVASVAKDQAQNVAVEAGSQAKDLLAQAKSELTEQASTQQGRLAETLRSLAAELESMAHHDGDHGMATNVVTQASTRAHDAASWLESGEPGQLLRDVQKYARRRPVAFLALAAAAGVTAGRLGRGVKDAGDDPPAATGSADMAVTRSATPPTQVNRPPFDRTPTLDTSYQPEHLDAPMVEARPFASSQVEDYRTLPDSGEGL